MEVSTFYLGNSTLPQYKFRYVKHTSQFPVPLGEYGWSVIYSTCMHQTLDLRFKVIYWSDTIFIKGRQALN